MDIGPINMFGLKDSDIMLINTVFAKYDRINKVVLYGSRATRNHRAASDIDLALFGNIDYDTLLRIENDIDDLLLPYHIDLQVFNNIKNNNLIEQIKKTGKVFYKKETAEQSVESPEDLPAR